MILIIETSFFDYISFSAVMTPSAVSALRFVMSPVPAASAGMF